MAEEIWGMNFDETGGWGAIRENMNKVTEEAVRRVQDDQKKAQQVGQQIKDDKITNTKLAEFLSFLLKNIKDEQVIKGLYETFFKVTHPQTHMMYLRKNINTIVIVWMFVPFYVEQSKKYWLHTLFAPIYDFDLPISLSSYITYLKLLSSTYHDNIPVDKDAFLHFLTHILKHHGLVDINSLNPEQYKELKDTLSKELYWPIKK